MIDTPPAIPIDISQEAPAEEAALPTGQRADGTLVIDLLPLAPPVEVEQCFEADPDPLANGIFVCRTLTTDQRLGDLHTVTADDINFGSAIPRARMRISEDASGEINGTNPAVGGWNAQGTEVRVRIGF
jgi:hypothetical protein